MRTCVNMCMDMDIWVFYCTIIILMRTRKYDALICAKKDPKLNSAKVKSFFNIAIKTHGLFFGKA